MNERKASPTGINGTKIVRPRPETKVIKAVKSTFIVISFVKLTIYTEYISYVELSTDTSFLWQASLLKIVLYVLGFAFYFFVFERRLLLESKIGQEEKLIQSHIESSDDGFNFLRKKQKLDSESDQLLRK